MKTKPEIKKLKVTVENLQGQRKKVTGTYYPEGYLQVNYQNELHEILSSIELYDCKDREVALPVRKILF